MVRYERVSNRSLPSEVERYAQLSEYYPEIIRGDLAEELQLSFPSLNEFFSTSNELDEHEQVSVEVDHSGHKRQQKRPRTRKHKYGAKKHKYGAKKPKHY